MAKQVTPFIYVHIWKVVKENPGIVQCQLLSELQKLGYSRSFAWRSIINMLQPLRISADQIADEMLVEIINDNVLDRRCKLKYKLNKKWEDIDEKTIRKFFVDGVVDADNIS